MTIAAVRVGLAVVGSTVADLPLVVSAVVQSSYLRGYLLILRLADWVLSESIVR